MRIFMGDRRTGKTYAATHDAYMQAVFYGRKVLYVCRNWRAAQDAFDRVAYLTSHLDFATVKRKVSSQGFQRIDYKNGGCVAFTTVRSSVHRGMFVDTVTLDDVDDVLTEYQELSIIPVLGHSENPLLCRTLLLSGCEFMTKEIVS